MKRVKIIAKVVALSLLIGQASNSMSSWVEPAKLFDAGAGFIARKLGASPKTSKYLLGAAAGLGIAGLLGLGYLAVKSWILTPVSNHPTDKEFLNTLNEFIEACEKNRPESLWLNNKKPDESDELENGLVIQKLVVPETAKIEFFTDPHADSGPLQDWLAKGQTEGWIDKNDRFKLIDKEGEERFYVFLGDYIDRGDEGLINLYILMNLYIKNPSKVVLLRGNHEDLNIACRYGFYGELKNNYPKLKPEKINKDVFERLSNACFLIWGNKGIFLTHGGFEESYNFQSLLQSKKAKFQFLSGDDPFKAQSIVSKSDENDSDEDDYYNCFDYSEHAFAWADFEEEAYYNPNRGKVLNQNNVKQWFEQNKGCGFELLGIVRGHQQSIFYNDKALQGAVVYNHYADKQWTPGSFDPLMLKDLEQPFVLTLDFFRYKPYPRAKWPKGKAPILTLELNSNIDKCKFTRQFLEQKKN